MYKRVVFVFLIIFSFNAVAQKSTETTKRQLRAVRLESAPRIDGMLNEAEWQKISFSNDFIQYSPYNGRKPSFQTFLKIAYDDNALYVGAYLADPSPDSILKELRARDDIDNSNSDIFGFQILPFNDGINMLEFKVSATNVQCDVKYSSNGSDENWDAVWQSSVGICDSGWVVELKIPFAAIRFPKKETQTWGFNAWREIRRYREWSTYNFVNMEISDRQPAVLTGIEHIKPPLRISLFPYVSGYLEKTPENNEAAYSFNYGLDLKYGLNVSFTLDMTMIPDFGQVQSDDEVLNLSPYEVQYDEKRQFFTEGTELFNKGGIFYSRRIGDTPVNYDAVSDSLKEGESIVQNPIRTSLINATKLSGRTKKGLGIGLFNAMTAKSEGIISDESGNEKIVETQPFTNYNIVVLDQILRENSYVGVINTNVRRKSYMANVSGTDFKLTDKKNTFQLDGKLLISQKYRDGEDTDLGHSYSLRFGKISGNFTYELLHSVKSDTYDPNDLGYLGYNNVSNVDFVMNYNKYEPFWKILSWSNEWSFSYNMCYAPRDFSSVSLYYNSSTTFRNYLSAGLLVKGSPVESFDFYEPRVTGWKYMVPPSYSFKVWFSPDYRKKLAIDSRFYYSHTTDYNINTLTAFVSPRLRISDKLFIVFESDYTYTINDRGYVANESDALGNDLIYFGKRNISTFTNTVDGGYIFNNKSSVSLKLRHYLSQADYFEDYYQLQEDGHLCESEYSGQHDISFSVFNIDLQYTWHFAPGSEVVLAWKNLIRENNDYVIYGYWKNLNETRLAHASNSISLKMIYYLDYMTFKGRS